jgi:trimeric autotransporter adhesin
MKSAKLILKFAQRISLATVVVALSANLTAQGLVIPPNAFVSVGTGANLFLPASDTLLLQSSASGSGSLVNRGSFTGFAKVQRYMTGAKWHIISSPVSGQSVNTFINSASNNIPSLRGTNPVQYGIMDYDEASDKWNPFFTQSTSGDFVAKRGYMVRNRADGVVTFGGGIIAGDQSHAVTRGKHGWSCIGNPFTSVMKVKGSGGFLSENSASLDPNFLGVYLWEEKVDYQNNGRKDYKVLCNAAYTFPSEISDLSVNHVPVGQGFFVKSKTGGANLVFKASMQEMQTGTSFRSANDSWPAIRLTVSGGGIASSTVVAFNENMTLGLDPSYDIGTLKGNPDFALYSKLIAGDAYDYAVQSLPNAEEFAIPIGFDCKAGGVISFSAETVGLSSDYGVVLEDIQTGALTDLTSAEGKYTTTIAAAASGAGRFILHAGKIKTDLPEKTIGAISIYAEGEAINISGNLQNVTAIDIYTTTGRLLGRFTLSGQKTFCVPQMTAGVYLVLAKGAQFTCLYKVVVAK